jgi:hypothetical protein
MQSLCGIESNEALFSCRFVCDKCLIVGAQRVKFGPKQIVDMRNQCVRNFVCGSTVWNMAAVRNFEVMFDSFSFHVMHTWISDIFFTKYRNKIID